MRILVTLLLATSCASPQLADLQSAANKRETICSFVRAWSDDIPELERAHELCDQEAGLRDIAAAYAGCYELEDPE